MIDWIDDEAKHWGRQMRWAHLGKDGWPPRTMLDKLIKEGIIGASAARYMQHFPEVLDERAVKFNNVMKELPEAHRTRFFIHYVVVGKSKVKAWRMNQPRQRYYEALDAAHVAFAAFAQRGGQISSNLSGQWHSESATIQAS